MVDYLKCMGENKCTERVREGAKTQIKQELAQTDNGGDIPFPLLPIPSRPTLLSKAPVPEASASATGTAEEATATGSHEEDAEDLEDAAAASPVVSVAGRPTPVAVEE